VSEEILQPTPFACVDWVLLAPASPTMMRDQLAGELLPHAAINRPLPTAWGWTPRHPMTSTR